VKLKHYAQLHLESLEQNQPELLRDLRRKGKLRKHLDALQRDAQEMRDQVRKDLLAKHPFNPVEWKKGRRAWEAWLDRTVEELVLNDLVLVDDPEESKGEEQPSLATTEYGTQTT